MFTNEDYERLLVKYTSQGIPAGESIQHFCDRHKVPYNLFDKWYRDTRHKVVKVKVDGMPTAGPASGPSLMESIMDEIKPHAKPSEREEAYIMMSRNRRTVRIYRYDEKACILHEKRFHPGYTFMRVEWEGDSQVFRINWRDVARILD